MNYFGNLSAAAVSGTPQAESAMGVDLYSRHVASIPDRSVEPISASVHSQRNGSGYSPSPIYRGDRGNDGIYQRQEASPSDLLAKFGGVVPLSASGAGSSLGRHVDIAA